MLAWCVASTHVQAELIAEDDLRKKGHEPFNPKALIPRIVRGCRQFTEQPYLRGYIFVAIDTDFDHWRGINFARGVKTLLYSAPYKPALVRQEAMAALLSICNGKYETDFSAIDRAIAKVLPPGTTVKVPSLGQSGKVTWTHNDRVRVMLSFLGTTREVELSRQAVEV